MQRCYIAMLACIWTAAGRDWGIVVRKWTAAAALCYSACWRTWNNRNRVLTDNGLLTTIAIRHQHQQPHMQHLTGCASLPQRAAGYPADYKQAPSFHSHYEIYRQVRGNISVFMVQIQNGSCLKPTSSKTNALHIWSFILTQDSISKHMHLQLEIVYTVSKMCHSIVIIFGRHALREICNKEIYYRNQPYMDCVMLYLVKH